MIQRQISKKIKLLAKKFPVISLTGPRQSGKTTLLRSLFPKYDYVTLEDPDFRHIAINDPRSFLNKYKNGVILDEVQQVPHLFSYIQTIVDETNKSGQFILSGSQSFLLNDKVSQSLAGRVAILNLLPFSIKELSKTKYKEEDIDEYIFKGFYPRLYDKNIAPIDYFPNYIQTYVERDVRQIINLKDLNIFIRFVKLCAGRVGQILNYSSIASDCGISTNTAKAWISLLEASFVIYLLQPHYKNFNKRLIKMPKIYFHDTGLLSSLLGIENKNQLSTHYAKGNIFENLIISEFIKERFNNGLQNNIYFWRDSKGIEIDCIIEEADNLIPIEIKSSHTFNEKFLKNLIYWNKLSDSKANESTVIYGGDISYKYKDFNIKSWKEF